MKNIIFGFDGMGDKIELDLVKEKINFILLVGATGSGKTIFHNFLYKQLSEKYSPNELGFVFLDNTMSNFDGWQSDYIVKSVIGRPKEAITALAEIANQEFKKILFIHIEECDMAYIDRAAVEASLVKLRAMKNVYVVYSTSRIDIGLPSSQMSPDLGSYLADWIRRFIDLKVVFKTALDDESVFLLGNIPDFNRRGKRVLAFNNLQIHCEPFSENDASNLVDFRL